MDEIRRIAKGIVAGALDAERDRLMTSADADLADIWLAIFSETAKPQPQKIPGAILGPSGIMETVQVSSHWTVGQTLTRRQLIDRIVSWRQSQGALDERPLDTGTQRPG